MSEENFINQFKDIMNKVKKKPTVVLAFIFVFISVYYAWNAVSSLKEKQQILTDGLTVGQIFAVFVCGITTLIWLHFFIQYKKSTPEPSAKLLPSHSLIEMAGICQQKDLDAFIIELANTGYIQVLAEGKDIFLLKKKDYDINDKKGHLMQALFARENTVNIKKTTKNSPIYMLYQHVENSVFGGKSMNDFLTYSLYKYFIISAFYLAGSYYSVLTYGGLGLWLYLFVSAGVLQVYSRFKYLASWVITQSVLFGIMYALYGKELMDFIDNMIQLNFHSKILTLILGVLIIIFNLLPIQKIALGDKLSPELKSLREFIFNALQSNQRKVLEEEQILDKEYGYKILPYVHVIGVITVQEWLKQYDFLYKETPHWFTGEAADLKKFLELFKSQEGIFGWNMDSVNE